MLTAVQGLIFGELEGAKAGPYRWLIHDRTLLLDVWEWLAFHADPWMRGILAEAGSEAALDFPDAKARPHTVLASPHRPSINPSVSQSGVDSCALLRRWHCGAISFLVGCDVLMSMSSSWTNWTHFLDQLCTSRLTSEGILCR